jgi:hypothetical protein
MYSSENNTDSTKYSFPRSPYLMYSTENNSYSNCYIDSKYSFPRSLYLMQYWKNTVR